MESGGVCGGGGDQGRLLHVIYFLSRRGRTEQPHLIRVYHLQRNGVYLRDVKRWVGEVRGKDMPEVFAWSCKRKYRNGYVWQDLRDDDLITPTCDNEYVVKGSELCIDAISTKECQLKAKTSFREDDSINGDGRHCPRISMSRKSCADVYDMPPVFSSDGSTLTEENTVQVKKRDVNRCDSRSERGSSRFYNILLKDVKSVGVGVGDEKIVETVNASDSSSSSSNSLMGKSKSFRTAKIFWNMMRCGDDSVDDSLIPVAGKADSSRPSSSSNDETPESRPDRSGYLSRKLLRRQLPPESNARKSCEGFIGKKKGNQSECNQAKVAANFRSAGAPRCSQCGNYFKPEKLYKHMKSCKSKPIDKAVSGSYKILFS